MPITFWSGRPQLHITNDDLAHRFNYHAPKTEEKAQDHAQVRDVLRNAAEAIVDLTGPASREQSLAITKLEECCFWANAAIAREILAPE